jgi:hypothetical protein
MTLFEYINTTNYRYRIVALLDEQRKGLTDKQFSQFAAPLQNELRRLAGEIAHYEEQSRSTIVAVTGTCDLFRRLTKPQAKLRADIWLHGSLQVAQCGAKGQYIKSEPYLFQDAWNSTDLLC